MAKFYSVRLSEADYLLLLEQTTPEDATQNALLQERVEFFEDGFERKLLPDNLVPLYQSLKTRLRFAKLFAILNEALVQALEYEEDGKVTIQ